MSTEYPPSLAASLAQLQTQLPRIAKGEKAEVATKTGGTYSYTYAGLSDISAQVLPLLGAVGLSFIATPAFDSTGRYVLQCTLLHTSGESREGAYPLPTSGTPQSLGSAITYGRRYILCAMTGVAPDEDDDGAAAEAAAATPKKAQRAPTVQRQQPRAAQAQRARRPAAPEPPLPGEDDPPPSAEGDQRSDKQNSMMHVLFNELNISERDKRLAYSSTLIGRPLESSNELTKDEASDLIDELQRVAQSDDPERALDYALAMAHERNESTEERTP